MYAYDTDTNMLTSALEWEAFHSVEFGHFIVQFIFTGWLEVRSEGELKLIVETENQHFLFGLCAFFKLYRAICN